MNCQKCKSKRLLDLNAHAKDLFSFRLTSDESKEYQEGYLPHITNLGSGDDLNMTICLDCGQVKGKWPAKTNIKNFNESLVDDDLSIDDEEYDKLFPQDKILKFEMNYYDIDKVSKANTIDDELFTERVLSAIKVSKLKPVINHDESTLTFETCKQKEKFQEVYYSLSQPV